MDEEEFDAAMQARKAQPYGTRDTLRLENHRRRLSALEMALWGRSPADLQRQLAGRYPEIPEGYDLADYHEVYRQLRALAAVMRNSKHGWASPIARLGATIVVGGARITEWEARCEIVRRAIEFLEKR